MELGANTSSASSRSLYLNKTYDCDGIALHMSKLCAASISKPLRILFNNSVRNQCFPNEWKKTNIMLFHKMVIKKKKITDQCHSCLSLAKCLKE